MSRYEETQRIVNSNIGTRQHRSLNNEYFTLLRIERVIENIALNLAELNDRLEKREGGLLHVNGSIQTQYPEGNGEKRGVSERAGTPD